MIDLSVIVPTLNEEQNIEHTLRAIRAGAPQAEIIVVDAGSSDTTPEKADPLCDQLVRGSRGRAAQMNLGASCASGAALAFVHADTIVPPSFATDIVTALSSGNVVGGRFDVQLDDPALLLRLTADLISWRSRISRTATGDQAIFVRADVFRRIGGFPEIEICEDLEFSRRLKREGTVACLRSRVTTSARRWRMEGTVRTILRMWSIKLMYLAGVSPARLKQMYSDAPR